MKLPVALLRMTLPRNERKQAGDYAMHSNTTYLDKANFANP